MTKKLLSLTALAILAALPLSASQFVQLPFDEVARNATLVVRGTLGPVTSAWDDDREVIYSTATLRVGRYLAGTGPRTLQVREVGGTVGDYTQEAIGFPALREGQEVVLFLSQWDDAADWRIEAYNQGKYRVRLTPHGEMVSPDTDTQGHERTLDGGIGRVRAAATMEDEGFAIEELASMVRAARETSGRPQFDRRK